MGSSSASAFKNAPMNLSKSDTWVLRKTKNNLYRGLPDKKVWEPVVRTSTAIIIIVNACSRRAADSISRSNNVLPRFRRTRRFSINAFSSFDVWVGVRQWGTGRGQKERLLRAARAGKRRRAAKNTTSTTGLLYRCYNNIMYYLLLLLLRLPPDYSP